jgi:hypothetical protein
MNWNIIWTSAVIATLLSTIANFFIWRYQKRQEFKYDYKKYILEKRKKAYDLVEDLFNYETSFHTAKKEQYYSFFDSHDNLVNFHDRLNSAYVVSFWLSNSLSGYLSQLFDLLGPASFIDAVQLQRFGILNHDKVYQLFGAIKNQYFTDLISLDNIAGHMESKGNPALVNQK